MSIASKHLYLNKDIILINTSITEVDMIDAGFSIIKEKKLFKKNIIEKINKMEKIEKHIYIGKKLKKNKEVSRIILDTFIEIRENFCSLNKIKPEQILSIKKDALFLINKEIDHLKIDNYEFKIKNRFTSYLYIKPSKIEVYFKQDDQSLIIKGLNDEFTELHSKGFLNLIKDLLIMNENKVEKKYYIDYLKNFRKKFISGNLDIEFYREFNKNSLFKIDDEKNENIFYIKYVNKDFLEQINISYNYEIFRYLCSLFL